MVDHVLLRPLPFPEPDRLVALESVLKSGESFYLVRMANWLDWQEGGSTLAASAVYRTNRVTVGVGDELMRAEGTEVAGGFFEAVLPRMSAGRPFSEIEAEADAPVVVLSRAFAERTVRATAALGRTLSVNGAPHTVGGVTAPGGNCPTSPTCGYPVDPVAVAAEYATTSTGSRWPGSNVEWKRRWSRPNSPRSRTTSA